VEELRKHVLGMVEAGGGTRLEGYREKIFLDRYALKGADGEPLERTPEEMWLRVAQAIAGVEPEQSRDEWTQKFYDVLKDFKFVPGGRILSGAGSGTDVTFYNCFVTPSPEDSVEGIFDNIKIAADIMRRSGGVGVNLSSLRPRGAYIKTVNGTSSGPCAWGILYSDMTGKVIIQGGSRRGALMLMLDDDHPDVEEFIEYKRKNPGHIDHANLSVAISDAFMQAVKDDGDWDLKWQDKVWRTVRARDLWRKIAESAHAYAEPGVVFMDRYNKRSNTWYFENIRCVNPCVTGDTLVYTGAGLYPAAELAEIGTPVTVASQDEDGVALRRASHVFPTGVKPVFKLHTREGYSVRLTADHRVMTTAGWKEASELITGDKIELLKGVGGFGVLGSLDEGRVLGWLVGDGYINKRRAGSVVLSFFGGERVLASDFAATVDRLVAAPEGRRTYAVGVVDIEGRDESRVESVRLLRRLDPDLMENKHQVPPSVFRGSREMQIGFLQALFTADGTVAGTTQKGYSVRLASSRLVLLEDVQRLLLNLGIYSKIYRERGPAGVRTLPDGKGGTAQYECNADYELVVSRASLLLFAETIGFLTDAKNRRLADAQSDRARRYYRQDYVATFSQLVPDGTETVYDLTEPEAHRFVANGLVVHNCGEQGLPAFGVCNLGAMNLVSFVKVINGEMYFDFEDLEESTKHAIRFLDDVIDATNYPFEENRQAQQGGARRTGLGTMGIADVLIKLGLRYGSDDATPVVERIYTTIRDAAYEASAEIAAEKGSFPPYDREKFLQGGFIRELPEHVREKIAEHGIRNAVLLTQAPTGTTSSLAGVNSGIEPVFAFITKRKDRLGEHVLYHPLAQEWKDAHPDIPLPDYFVSSADLTPAEHLAVQATIQAYTDSSISKTINGPATDTVEMVEQLYLDAYDQGCKGVTYYRQGSRDAVLEAVVEQAAEKVAEKVVESIGQNRPVEPATIKSRDQVVQGYTRQMRAPEGKVNITLNSEAAGLFEVFINLGKAGSDIAAMAEALGRLISLNLQMPSPMTANERAWEMADQLRGIGGSRTVGFGPSQVRSLPDAVAAALLKHLQTNSPGDPHSDAAGNGGAEHDASSNGSNGAGGNGAGATDAALLAASTAQQLLENTVQLTGNLCPSCGCNSLVAQEGCRKCYVCGHSEC